MDYPNVKSINSDTFLFDDSFPNLDFNYFGACQLLVGQSHMKAGISDRWTLIEVDICTTIAYHIVFSGFGTNSSCRDTPKE